MSERTWSVQEVAEMTGLSGHTLRYYEREGLIERVNRLDSSGHRRYTATDIAVIIFLTKLRATGMPIRRLKEYVALVREGDGTMDARRAILEDHKTVVCQQIADLQESVALIDKKIASYNLLSPHDLIAEMAAKIAEREPIK